MDGSEFWWLFYGRTIPFTPWGLEEGGEEGGGRGGGGGGRGGSSLCYLCVCWGFNRSRFMFLFQALRAAISEERKKRSSLRRDISVSLQGISGDVMHAV